MSGSSLRELVEMLLSGRDGDAVVAHMRTRPGAFTTECSLQAYVSKVRALLLESDDPRKYHPDHATSLAALRRSLPVPPGATDAAGSDEATESGTDSGAACRRAGEAFLSASFRVQHKLTRRHQRRQFCLHDETVDAVFRRVRLLPDNLTTFRVSADEAEECRTRAVRSTLRRQESVLVVHGSSEHLDRAVLTLETCDERTCIGALGVALLLVSGRRMAEVFNGRSSFRALDGSPTAALFAGQLKTDHPTPYAIPLLCTLAVFQRGLDELRRRQGQWDARRGAFVSGAPSVLNLTNSAVHTRYASNLNKYLKRNGNLDGASVHDLRRFYIQAVWLGYKYEETQSTFNRVAMQFLGHAGIEESLKYNSVRLRGFKHAFTERLSMRPRGR
jgi:hypothetical protein